MEWQTQNTINWKTKNNGNWKTENPITWFSRLAGAFWDALLYTWDDLRCKWDQKSSTDSWNVPDIGSWYTKN